MEADVCSPGEHARSDGLTLLDAVRSRDRKGTSQADLVLVNYDPGCWAADDRRSGETKNHERVADGLPTLYSIRLWSAAALSKSDPFDLFLLFRNLFAEPGACWQVELLVFFFEHRHISPLGESSFLPGDT